MHILKHTHTRTHMHARINTITHKQGHTQRNMHVFQKTSTPGTQWGPQAVGSVEKKKLRCTKTGKEFMSVGMNRFTQEKYVLLASVCVQNLSNPRVGTAGRFACTHTTTWRNNTSCHATSVYPTVHQVAISVCGVARSSLNLAMSYTAVQNTSISSVTC